MNFGEVPQPLQADWNILNILHQNNSSHRQSSNYTKTDLQETQQACSHEN